MEFIQYANVPVSNPEELPINDSVSKQERIEPIPSVFPRSREPVRTQTKTHVRYQLTAASAVLGSTWVLTEPIMVSQHEKKPDRSLREKRLQTALEEALHSDAGASPRQVALAAGYRSPDRALRKFSTLVLDLKNKIKKARTCHREKIRTMLKAAMHQDPPPTLHEIAASLNMINSSRLRVYEPALCDDLLTRRRHWKAMQQEKSADSLRHALQERDLPGLKRLCNDIGVSFEMLSSRFPNLRQEHRTLYLQQKNSLRAARKLEFQVRVKAAVCAIRDRDEYPSAGKVLLENPALRSGGWHQIQEAIRMALTALDEEERGAKD